MSDSRSIVETERRPSVSAPSLPKRVGDTPLRVKWRSRCDKRRARKADAKVALVVRASASAWNMIPDFLRTFLSCAGRLDIELAHVGSETGADDTLSGTMMGVVGNKSVAIVNLAGTGETWEDEKELTESLALALTGVCFERLPTVEKRAMAGRLSPASAKSPTFESDMETALSMLHFMLQLFPSEGDVRGYAGDLLSLLGVVG